MKIVSGFFIGYYVGSRGFIFYCPSHSTRVIEPDRAVFFKDDFGNGVSTPQPVFLKKDCSFLPIPVIYFPTDTIIPITHNNDHNLLEDDIVPPLVNEQELEHITEPNVIVEPNDTIESIPVRRSQRTRKTSTSNDYAMYL